MCKLIVDQIKLKVVHLQLPFANPPARVEKKNDKLILSLYFHFIYFVSRHTYLLLSFFFFDYSSITTYPDTSIHYIFALSQPSTSLKTHIYMYYSPFRIFMGKPNSQSFL